MVRRYALAAESWVLTANGPGPAGLVHEGDRLWALDGHGGFALAPVAGVALETASPHVELLTKAGDVLVPGATRLASVHGPVRASDIRPGARQLEVLRPGQAPQAFGSPKPLEGLSGALMQTPAGSTDHARLEYLLSKAGVACTRSDAPEWHVLAIDAPGTASDWTWKEECDLLRLLTAWVDGQYRTREHDRRVRRRLLWSFVAADVSYEARWAPAYRPVECRASAVERLEPFNSIACARNAIGTTVVLEVAAASGLVADLAYVLPA